MAEVAIIKDDPILWVCNSLQIIWAADDKRVVEMGKGIRNFAVGCVSMQNNWLISIKRWLVEVLKRESLQLRCAHALGQHLLIILPL